MAAGNGKPKTGYVNPPLAPPHEQLLTVGDVAVMFNASVDTIRRYYRCHGMPSIRRGPQGPRLFDRQAVMVWWRRFCSSPTGQAERRDA